MLGSLKFLVTLDLAGNRLSKLPDFTPPPLNLQEMDLSRNQIMNMGDLSQHRYLRKLCLDRNLIKKIHGISQCHYLTHLSLRHNGIVQLENLSGSALKFLDLVGGGVGG